MHKSHKRAHKHGYLFMLIISFVCLSVQVAAQDWTEKASRDVNKPSSRYQHSMTYDSNCKVVVMFGGFVNNSLLNDTWEYSGCCKDR